MSWKDARIVVAASISPDADFANTNPPTVPTDDVLEIPSDIRGERVKSLEVYLWVADGQTLVGRATLAVDLQLVDVDQGTPRGLPSIPAETQLASGLPPYSRFVFDATPGPRRVFVRVDAVAGAAAAVFSRWGIRYREVF